MYVLFLLLSYFLLTWGLGFPWLILNSWVQVILLPQPPKKLELQSTPLHLAFCLFVFRWKGKDGRAFELNSEPEEILLGCVINLRAGKKEFLWREQGDVPIWLGPCEGCTCPYCAETWEEELPLQRTKEKTEKPDPIGCCLLFFIGPKG